MIIRLITAVLMIPYEAIKVIEAWKLGFNLGNTVKYIRRADYKDIAIVDLEKARWYLDREIQKRKDEAEEGRSLGGGNQGGGKARGT